MPVKEVIYCVSGMYQYIANDCGGGHILCIMDLPLLIQCLWRRPYLVYQGCTTTYPMTVEEVISRVSGMYHYLTNDCGGGHILYIRNALTHKQCLRRRSYLVYQGCTNTYSVSVEELSSNLVYQGCTNINAKIHTVELLWKRPLIFLRYSFLYLLYL